ncbi:MAG: MFS transporter, partial [bacterium]|nr:MFS transporter [bacterium]
GEIEGGLTPAAAGSALGLLALFNGLGRIVWGTISQKLGARKAIALDGLLQAAMLFYLFQMGSTELSLTIAGCWIGFNFGGNLALFPLAVAESFGTKNLGANYGAMFTAYGVGGIIMPMLAGGVSDRLGSHFWAFIAAGGACVLAMLLALTVKPPHHSMVAKLGAEAQA